MNNITIYGRVVADPETKFTTSGTQIGEFTVAVDRGFGENKETDFFRCVAFKKTAEVACNYLRKGNQTLLSGSMQCQKWTDKDGNKKEKWQMIVNNLTLLQNSNKQGGNNPSNYSAPAQSKQNDDFDPFAE